MISGNSIVLTTSGDSWRGESKLNASVIMSCNYDDDHCSLLKYEMIVNITPATVSPLIQYYFSNVISIQRSGKLTYVDST